MKRFQRTEEDFVCEHCHEVVKGSGYTNHCPRCLWSKHVDVNPGDRRETCGGMIQPVSVEVKGGEYTILHRCTKCGATRRNKAAENDSIEAVIALSRNPEA